MFWQCVLFVLDVLLGHLALFGTFARAVDEASTLKQPSLHMSAAAASRDITLFHAMDLLQEDTPSLIFKQLCSAYSS